MNRKWSANKVRVVLEWLQNRWPELFAPGPDLKPLSLDIHKEILKFRSELPELSCRTLDEALKRHMTSHGYLYGMAKHTHRVDLDGKEVEPVNEGHRAWASQLLRAKQKEAQRTGKGRKKKAIRGNRGKKPAFLDKQPARKSQRVGSAGGASAPVIRYKQRRKRTIAPAEEVELAG